MLAAFAFAILPLLSCKWNAIPAPILVYHSYTVLTLCNVLTYLCRAAWPSFHSATPAICHLTGWNPPFCSTSICKNSCRCYWWMHPKCHCAVWWHLWLHLWVMFLVVAWFYILRVWRPWLGNAWDTFADNVNLIASFAFLICQSSSYCSMTIFTYHCDCRRPLMVTPYASRP